MFFKLLTLFVIAYFIYRSLRNLIDASLGRPQNQQQFQQRPTPRHPSARPPSREENRPVEKSARDIEDAKWTDLQ